MKLTASILIVYFSLLIGQPFVNIGIGIKIKPNSCHPAGMCCREMAKHKGDHSSNQANTCNRDFCNPFMPCGISISYEMPVSKFENRVLELKKNQKPANNDAIISNYLSDCWRPPELA